MRMDILNCSQVSHNNDIKHYPENGRDKKYYYFLLSN